MKIGVLCFTAQGASIARKITYPDAQIVRYGSKRAAGDGILPYAHLGQQVRRFFAEMDCIVFVGACGIAVRAIAPYVQDKWTDPAVLVIDELGQWVISLLSGHVGGANALAEQIAENLQAQPIITTATDLQGQFAVDVFAKQHRLVLSDRNLAKRVSASLLHGEPVGFYSAYPIAMPKGLTAGPAKLGIAISHERVQPFAQTLYLPPKNLVIGIGCKQGVPEEIIQQAVDMALETKGLCREAICRVASIDRKANEPGLLAFCSRYGLPFVCYSAETLRQVAGCFTASPFVEKTVGVDNVCERSAAKTGHHFLVRKTAWQGVTVAIAEEKTWEDV